MDPHIGWNSFPRINSLRVAPVKKPVIEDQAGLKKEPWNGEAPRNWLYCPKVGREWVTGGKAGNGVLRATVDRAHPGVALVTEDYS